MEQLTKSLASLYGLYDANRSFNINENEAEFRSFYVLLHLVFNSQSTGETLALWFRCVASPIIKSIEMCFARRILRINFYYLQVHPDAADFQYKTIENWVEMGIVVGEDQATGSMAEAGLDFGDEFDCANVEQFPRMNKEFGIYDIAKVTEASIEQSKGPQATSSTSRRHGKKPRVSDELVQIIDRVATSMDKIAKAMHIDVEAAYASDLYAKVMKIEGFEFDFLDDAFRILNGDDKLSRAFLARNERGKRKMLEKMVNKDGLALNDDLQRLLAKHEAIASGTSIRVEKPKPFQALVDDDLEVTTGDNSAWPDGSDIEVEQLVQDAEKYTLASHLLWGLWGIISVGAHVTLESLLGDKELKLAIKDLVCSSGRSHPPVEGVEVQGSDHTTAVVPEKQQVCSGQGRISVTTQLNGVPQKEAPAVS
ncbi:hypothetical protein HHK36_011662 [Tetracentron sinense]|uniref:SAC3/GANP/THP3 conserved domain-containing protein n=1 Tax=Tetracentron sinense TaxID=13715 RepID=A0A835DHF0_TETSI|nr:hypothetical protein HHK36_011662 [Tetracentron sinense]